MEVVSASKKAMAYGKTLSILLVVHVKEKRGNIDVCLILWLFLHSLRLRFSSDLCALLCVCVCACVAACNIYGIAKKPAHLNYAYIFVMRARLIELHNVILESGKFVCVCKGGEGECLEAGANRKE